jgi:2-polyprenyl-6-methoxyphenol hydroxylase-like FAD-dependent oxidoreductase
VIDVIVAGAGPTGLVLASELVRRGVRVRLVDARAEPNPQSRAYGVHARTVEILDAMGLADELLAAGRRTVGAHVYERRTHLLHTRMDHLPSAWPFLLSVPQSVTEAALERRLRGLGGAVERGTSVAEAWQDEDGVTVTLRTALGERAVRARWLVGCDGARSTVRTVMGADFVGRSYPEDWMLADLRVDWDLSYDELHGFVTPQGYVSFNPRVGDRAFRLVFDVSGSRWAGRRELRAVDLQQVLDERGLPGRIVGEPEWSAPFRTHCRLASRWRAGRLLLAGDAAHIHSPIGGQGMNAGIQDAWNLGWKLAAVVAGAPAALLDSYERERLPVARRILQSTDQANRWLTGRGALHRASLRVLGRALSWFPGLLRQATTATSGLTIGYGEASRVALDHRGWTAASRTGRPILLVPPGALPPVRPDLEVLVCDVPDLVLVRPDLYVGARGPEAVARWLQGWTHSGTQKSSTQSQELG